MSSQWYLYLFFTACLIGIGIYALLTMKNLIKVFIGAVIIGKGVGLALLSTGFVRQNILLAQSLVITCIVIEVCMVATALALIIRINRRTKSLDIRTLARLKG
jgi:multicomponent Na+:H+ antiporter subunit C